MLLQVNNLHLSLSGDRGERTILRGISFAIKPGEIVGIMGPSGCGKSLTVSAIFGLLPPKHTLRGSILFADKDLTTTPPKELSYLYGTKLGLVLQDPNLALNPLVSIGNQLIEGLCYHKKIAKEIAWKIGTEWLTKVGISDASQRMHQYPHEISGGMKQRILIAMALICQPCLLIADEPTTALDLTIQMQILDLLESIQTQEKMSMLLISHDKGVIAKSCHRVLIMDKGEIIENRVLV